MSVILCTAGYDHTIRFWEALSGLCSRTIQHPDSQVNRLCISPDKRWLAAAGADSVKLFDISSTNPSPVMLFKGHTGNVTGVAFQCDSTWMVTSSEDGTLKVWNIRDGKVQRNYMHSSPVNDVVIHPNQGELIACDRGGSIRIWDLGKDVCAHELQPNPGVIMHSVTVAANGTLMCAGDNTGMIHMWRLESEGPNNENTRVIPFMTFKAHNAFVLRVLLSPDVRHLATCSADHTTRIWEIDANEKHHEDPKYQQLKQERLPDDLRRQTIDANFLKNNLLLEATLVPHHRWVWDCAFSADSAYLVTASSDHHARLWELSTSSLIKQYNGHHRGLTTVALNDYSETR